MFYNIDAAIYTFSIMMLFVFDCWNGIARLVQQKVYSLQFLFIRPFQSCDWQLKRQLLLYKIIE